MTVSPCSCMIRRNTPCVLGCWGPRFSVIRFSSSTTPSSPGASKMVSPSSGLWAGISPGMSVSAMRAFPSVGVPYELLYGDVFEVCFEIPPHGEADKVVGQQDASQIGMAQEANAHHFEGF